MEYLSIKSISMKKFNVKFMEYVPKPGRCVKAVVKETDMDGTTKEKTLYARSSFIYNENKIVSVQEVSEEEYNEWLSGTCACCCGIGC
jgi:hypothetical protein